MPIQNNNSTITIESTNSVVLSNDSVFFIVDQRDWNRLKRAVNNYQHENDLWNNFGFASFGIGGSAIVTAFSLSSADSSVANTKLILWIAGAFFILIGIICCVAHKSTRKLSTTSINEIKTAIDDIDNNIKK